MESAPEIPTFGWFTELPADSSLRTKTQLAQHGLRPGGPVRGRVIWRRKRRVIAVYDLYDEREATPKRMPTPAQQAALAKAQIALKTCKHCGTTYDHRLADRRCRPCRAAQAAAAERARLAKIQRKARVWLADPQAVILDTETTDIDGYIVQIAVIDMAGTVLLDTLVNPHHPISPEAQAIHHITEEQLQDAPTFADLSAQLTTLLHGRRVIVYNRAFDTSILSNEIIRSMGVTRWGEEWFVSVQAAQHWLNQVRWRCAMLLYAAWVGDWSDYWGGYRWQPLPSGDHRALGDCQATLRLLRTIADADLADAALASVEP